MRILEVRANLIALIIGTLLGGVNVFLTEPPLYIPILLLVLPNIVVGALAAAAYPKVKIITLIVGAVLGALIGVLTSFWLPLLMGGILYPFTLTMNSKAELE